MVDEHFESTYDLMPSAVTIDSTDAAALASWWAGLLGVEMQQMGGYYWLRRQEGGRFSLTFQQVPEPKAGKNRVHVDFAVGDLEAATDRILSAGGAMLAEHVWGEDGPTWRVMEDPQGNEFCIIPEDAF